MLVRRVQRGENEPRCTQQIDTLGAATPSAAVEFVAAQRSKPSGGDEELLLLAHRLGGRLHRLLIGGLLLLEVDVLVRHLILLALRESKSQAKTTCLFTTPFCA